MDYRNSTLNGEATVGSHTAFTESRLGSIPCYPSEALEVAPEAFAADLEEQKDRAPEDWSGRLEAKDDSFVLGAFVDGHIVGTVGFRREVLKKLRHKGVIFGMYVSPSSRRRGIGRRLLTELMAQLQLMQGLEQVTLSVVTDNTAARELYLSLGLQVFGKEVHALKVADRYLDEEYMVLFLQ